MVVEESRLEVVLSDLKIRYYWLNQTTNNNFTVPRITSRTDIPTFHL